VVPADAALKVRRASHDSTKRGAAWPVPDRMTIEEVVGKVLLDEHADVIREAVRAVAAELMNAHRRDAQRRSATPGFRG
jgi:hypothetical protein